MTIYKISGGSAKVGQLMQLIFFVPFMLLLFYITLVNFSFGVLLFFIICSAIMAFLFYIGLSYGDLYLADDYLIIKKIFTSKKMDLSEIVEIDRGLLPFTYYIKFKNNSTVYFTSKLGDIPAIFFSMDPNQKLNEIKSFLHKQEENDNDLSKNIQTS